MLMGDPVHELAHDHADLNRRVLDLGALIEREQRAIELIAPVRELRELLFLHFAREEEALFPFVIELVPQLRDQIEAMATAHDAICGALARMLHLASTDTDLPAIAAVFVRFEAAYASHAKAEAALLVSLDDHLTADQVKQLAQLVDGI